MKLLTFQKLGTAHNAPRVWLESQRLNSLGFSPGTRLSVASQSNRLVLTPSSEDTGNRVSQRRAAGGVRPIIDLNSMSLLKPISDYVEVKIEAAFNRICVSPSVRAFYIRKHLKAKPPYRTFEVFAGGGLLGAGAGEDYEIVGGLEIEPDYADVWQKKNPNATLIQSDIRLTHPSELPFFDVMLCGIPCTSHSNLGRAKKGLANKPELGDTGDLFMPVANIIACRMPLACVFENVPSFGTSLAGMTLKHHLKQLGYYIYETVLDPHGEWNEPQDRKRWMMVATLYPGFQLFTPKKPFVGTCKDFIDPPSAADKEDVECISGSIQCLNRRAIKHEEEGNGFGYTTINQNSTRVPTLVRSYYKVNLGPFVETEYGPRMLRKTEAEKLMGCSIDCDHYATAIQVLFQGVQTRVFRSVLDQLASFLFISSVTVK